MVVPEVVKVVVRDKVLLRHGEVNRRRSAPLVGCLAVLGMTPVRVRATFPAGSHANPRYP
jgi:hypothetical protein